MNPSFVNLSLLDKNNIHIHAEITEGEIQVRLDENQGPFYVGRGDYLKQKVESVGFRAWGDGHTFKAQFRDITIK
jgi:hypothetical protein